MMKLKDTDPAKEKTSEGTSQTPDQKEDSNRKMVLIVPLPVRGKRQCFNVMMLVYLLW